MKTGLQVTFRNMAPSVAVEEWIHAEAAKLESFYNSIMSCRVAVEVPHRHRRRGSPHHVRIDLTLPKGEIVVKRESTLASRVRHLGEARLKKQLETKAQHKNLRLAINDAFKAAGRQLQDYARRQRGYVKSHVPLPVGRVSRILADEGYGFLTAEDGREIYFHRNSVLNRAFPRLKEGTAVSFVEELGEKGPQASTVRILARRRIQQPAKQAAALTA